MFEKGAEEHEEENVAGRDQGRNAEDTFGPEAKLVDDLGKIVAAVGEVARQVLAEQAVEQAIYIGDRSEDGESADTNGLPFIAVTWGYGSLTVGEMRADWRAAAKPEALGALLLGE